MQGTGNPGREIELFEPAADARHYPAEIFADGAHLSAALNATLQLLRERLGPFLTNHPEWSYGRVDRKKNHVWYWYIGYEASRDFPMPYVRIDFWTEQPMDIYGGHTDHILDLEPTARFIAQVAHDSHATVHFKVKGWFFRYRLFSRRV